MRAHARPERRSLIKLALVPLAAASLAALLAAGCGSSGAPSADARPIVEPGGGHDLTAAPDDVPHQLEARLLDGSELLDGGAAAGKGDSRGEGSAPGATTGSCSGPKPGPGNTGVPAGTKLTPSGSLKVTQNGAVVEALDINGTITVLADNVTIRKVRITTGDYYPIRYFDKGNVGLVVEDSEIVGTSGTVTSAIAFANYTARRLNIHGSADGLKANANVLIEDCWIHDLANGAGQHNDAVQSTGGKGVTIRHSVLQGASNAAVQTGDEDGRVEDLTITCSWLHGGGYTLNIRGNGATVPKNTKVTNNRFDRTAKYGPWTFDDPAPTVTGNVYDDKRPAHLLPLSSGQGYSKRSASTGSIRAARQAG